MQLVTCWASESVGEARVRIEAKWRCRNVVRKVVRRRSRRRRVAAANFSSPLVFPVQAQLYVYTQSTLATVHSEDMSEFDWATRTPHLVRRGRLDEGFFGGAENELGRGETL